MLTSTVKIETKENICPKRSFEVSFMLYQQDSAVVENRKGHSVQSLLLVIYIQSLGASPDLFPLEAKKMLKL